MSVKIALAGNPNCGKTTLFNALTGSSQYVGNWPGVTVEKKEGHLKGHGKEVEIQDLPGIYSLSPYTLEEVVARNYLVNEEPDAILNIVDGTNIERNLYLTTQLLELGVPVVIAVNMMDIVRKNGDSIDIDRIKASFGCDVVEISALKGENCIEAAEKAVEAAKAGKDVVPPHVFTGSVEHAIGHIDEIVEQTITDKKHTRWYSIKLFERDEKVQDQLNLSAEQKSHIEEHIKNCEDEMDDDAESIITNQRYAYINDVCGRAVKKGKAKEDLTISDKIDKIVTNRILALPIFALVMFCVYYISVTTVGTILTDFTNDTLVGEWIQAPVQAALENAGCADWLTGLLVDGIIGGVGAVIGFVPQMLVLFFLLALLEQVGYMARVAFILDRIFRRFGLSGKSFIPMLIGSGCGIPGVMASRTIENERDRRMTVMTTTFIPCGAKVPIIALFAGALFNGSGVVSVSAYFIGAAAIVISGLMLKKTKPFAGEVAPFVMELPAYHIPGLGSVLRSMWERGWSFIKRAGTIILASTVILWFLQAFGPTESGFGMVEDNAESLLAIIGNAIAPVFAPLGFGTWQATVATITGLIAKEEVVSTMGVLFGGFEELSEEGTELYDAMAAHFTQLSAYSFMIFNLLCAPCFAAMGAIRREMNSGKWTAFAIAYQCVFAYIIALIVYQLGMIATGSFGVGTVIAVILLIGLIYMIVRPNKYRTDKALY